MLCHVTNVSSREMHARLTVSAQRKLALGCFAAAVAAVGATAASARDVGAYAGVEGGTLSSSDMHGNAAVHFTGNTLFVCLPGKPLCESVEEDQVAGLHTKLKRGTDVAAVAGYDFGPVRLEAELGWKRMERDGLALDPSFLDYFNAVLRRPSTTAGALPAVSASDFGAFDGKVSAKTAMANLLGDFGSAAGFSIYGGGGVGRVWARALNDGDSAWAVQAIAGVRRPVHRNIQVGLQYRYFRTGSLRFVGEPLEFIGNPFVDFAGDIMFVNQASARVTPQFTSRLHAHSLLVTAFVSFGHSGH